MTRYTVNYYVTECCYVTVEAESEEEAQKKVADLYEKGEISYDDIEIKSVIDLCDERIPETC